MKKISVIFGTRPEAIKLAPVILALKAHSEFECNVCVTAQHRQMLDSILGVFNIVPEVDLDLMRTDQTLASLMSSGIEALDLYIKDYKPDAVLVQGDTVTTLAGAMVAFFNRVPVAHLEAGLRTGNLFSPWPEEGNRKMVTQLATLHLAPTSMNRDALLQENVDKGSIEVTGNTVIDALMMALDKIEENPLLFNGDPRLGRTLDVDRDKFVLITGHRRENFGVGFKNICRAISSLAERYPDIQFVYPVHLNPNVRQPVSEILGDGKMNTSYGVKDNIHLIEPLDYLSFVALMKRSYLILTDSGGVQEEAPSLGKPVLVIRDTTERPEAVHAGTVKLIGTDYNAIVDGVSQLIDDEELYKSMSMCHNPYGDGKATERVIEALRGI